MTGEVILEVKDLSTYFDTDEGVVKSVDGVSFDLKKGRSVCLVGESGCGKSVTSFTLMRLIPMPPGRIAKGEILYKGEDLTKIPESRMRRIRGNNLAMIFQEPMTSLNPVYTVGNQIMEAVLLHQEVGRQEARQIAIDMLKKVGIPDPESRIDDYPHQMSGGMKQRVMIAMALACKPDILIADEPTTALDVTIQAQILDLLQELQKTEDMAILLITHDLAVVAEMADEVLVMYASKIVEKADVKTLFENPLHPYTKGLLAAIPRLGHKEARLNEIPGQVPKPQNYPKGCHFADRCQEVMDCCRREKPLLSVQGEDHEVACFLYQKELSNETR
jgi:oligopeptide/dipeptide ABC transporter ATP-binding protein